MNVGVTASDNPADVGRGLVFCAFECVVQPEVAAGLGAPVIIDRQGQECPLVDVAARVTEDGVWPARIKLAGGVLEKRRRCGAISKEASLRNITQDDGYQPDVTLPTRDVDRFSKAAYRLTLALQELCH